MRLAILALAILALALGSCSSPGAPEQPATVASPTPAAPPAPCAEAEVARSLTCIVCGEPLVRAGSAPAYRALAGRRVVVCSEACATALEAEPAPHLARIDAALAGGRASYPLETCVVSKEPIETPVELLYGDRLVRFCCPGCVKPFRSDPASFLAQIDSAAGAP